MIIWIFINIKGRVKLNKLAKLVLVAAALSTLTACTGRIENKTKDCSYDYLLHPAISISKVIGGCGPTDK
jgi:hypothetical protein